MSNDRPNILIVDDNPDNLFVMREVLSANFPHVNPVVAESADRALEIVATETISGAIIDVQMPGKSGIDLLKVLRSNERTKDLFVTMITSHSANAHDKAEALNHGAIDFISRPLEVEELNARINTMLRQNRNFESERKRVLSVKSDFKQIFDSIPDGMSVVDLECNILYANSAMGELYSFDNQKLKGLKCNVVFNNPLCETSDCILQKMIIEEREYKTEIVVNRPAGERIIQLTVFPYKNIEKKLVGIIQNFTDITEKKRRQQNDDEIASRAQQSEKLEALGQLVGGVVHDFNNQLAVILGYSTLLKTKGLHNDEGKAKVDKVIKSAKSLSALTKQLLAFSRSDEHHANPLDVYEPLEDTIDILKRTIDKKIEIKSSFDAINTIVLADQVLLQNAFLNIAINARDVMPNGGTLDFRTRNIEISEKVDGGINLRDAIEIEISDSGEGMDEATCKKIFDPYFTTKEKDKGTGLGLSVVYGTITSCGGTIEVSSEVGVGTTFRIILPIESEFKGVAERFTDEGVTLGSGTILIIDDDRNVGVALKEMLELSGYKVTYCDDGNDAMKLWKSLPLDAYDLIILDVIMPNIGGEEVYQMIRLRKPDQKVLLSTGFGEGAFIDYVKSGEFSDVIKKPYSVAEIGKCLKAFLSKK